MADNAEIFDALASSQVDALRENVLISSVDSKWVNIC